MSTMTEDNIARCEAKIAGIDRRMAEFEEELATTEDARRDAVLRAQLAEYGSLRRGVASELARLREKETIETRRRNRR